MTTTTTKRPTRGPTAAVTAIYARISEDRQNGAGVERQLEDTRALCQRKGWAIAGEYIDNDISASDYTRRVRPQYRAMLKAIEEGHVARIVVWATDRLYRQVPELYELIQFAKAGRVEIASVKGGDLDLSTSDGIMTATILVSVAAKSSADTSARITRQKQQRRELGLSTGGPRPFGWQADRSTPHPAEARHLHRAWDAILSGSSLCDVARSWSASGVRSRSWNSSDVAKALTMPRHAGLVVHHGDVVGEGKWKPLLDRARWEQVCAAVRGRGTGVGVPRRRSMLTGIAICGACGARMTRSSAGRRGMTVWRCHAGPGQAGCGKVSIRADLLEPLVVAATLKYVDTVDLAALVGEGAPDLREVNKQMLALDRRESQLAASFARGGTTARILEQATAIIERDRNELRNRLARETNRNTLSAYAGRTGALRAAWPSLTTDQRRAIIAESLRRVTVKPAPRTGAKFDPERVILGRA